MNDLPDFDTATTNGSEPPKRQRGRPPGSKNKARKGKTSRRHPLGAVVRRGRPPGRPPAAILPITPFGGAAPQLVANAVNAITALSEEGRKYVIAIIAGMNK